jgi:hypothetical protein
MERTLIAAPWSRAAALLRKAGVDRAVGFTVLGRGWSALSGLGTLLLMTRFLSPVQQGYYFTFGSVLGLSVFFELGLSLVLIQFASHERASLEWTAEGTLEGDPAAKARLASLLRRSLKWYAVAAGLLAIVLLPVGFVFFSRHPNPGVTWQVPWIWIVLVTSLTVALTPVLAILEGCGLIAKIARLQMWQNFAGSLLLWLVLIRHGGIYSAPVTNTVVLAAQLVWVGTRQKAFLKDLLQYRGHAAQIDWRGEVWPLQWKIALSYISGYLIFQLFNPLLFATRGAAAAGQMGLSLALMGAIGTIALAWVATKTAPFGVLIARKEYGELDRLFFPCLWQSLTLVCIACSLVWGVSWLLQSAHFPIGSRLLPPLPLGFLALAAVANHVVFAEAIYLRAHKQEPLLVLSVGVACLLAVSLGLVAKPFGAAGMMLCYFLICTVAMGMATGIFRAKRRQWHGASAREAIIHDAQL